MECTEFVVLTDRIGDIMVELHKLCPEYIQVDEMDCMKLKHYDTITLIKKKKQYETVEKIYIDNKLVRSRDEFYALQCNILTSGIPQCSLLEYVDERINVRYDSSVSKYVTIYVYYKDLVDVEIRNKVREIVERLNV